MLLYFDTRAGLSLISSLFLCYILLIICFLLVSIYLYFVLLCCYNTWCYLYLFLREGAQCKNGIFLCVRLFCFGSWIDSEKLLDQVEIAYFMLLSIPAGIVPHVGSVRLKSGKQTGWFSIHKSQITSENSALSKANFGMFGWLVLWDQLG